jgi:hypothetical protein
MSFVFAIVATGERRYVEEALASIRWHHQQRPKSRSIVYVDAGPAIDAGPAEVRTLTPIPSSLPPMVVGWYRKTQVLRELLASTDEPICLLDTYARVLRPDLLDDAVELADRFHLCLSLDPRRTLERELKGGRGIGPEIQAQLAPIPSSFPLWNTGVVLAQSHPASRTLVETWERLSRQYLDRGILFREQLTLIEAAWETSIAPFTLPESFNVRRPWIEPAIVLHTRRFGHAYGLPEVDRPEQWGERWRHRLKMMLGRVSGLDRWFSP